MNAKKFLSANWFFGKESIVTALVGWVPLSVGKDLRRVLYRSILARIGTSVRIKPDVEFVGAQGIEIGNGVVIDSDVRLRNCGQNSRICLEDYVKLDVGVYIKTHFNADINIGAHTYIGPYTCLSGNSIQIGQDCRIASHVGIYANNHTFADPTRKIREQGGNYKGIVIEEDCWLGTGVKVVDGVTIGKGSVIGAGAVVTKDIPPYSVAVGVPAKVISRRSAMNETQEQLQLLL